MAVDFPQFIGMVVCVSSISLCIFMSKKILIFWFRVVLHCFFCA